MPGAAVSRWGFVYSSAVGEALALPGSRPALRAFPQFEELLENFGVLLKELRKILQHVYRRRAQVMLDTLDIFALGLRGEPE